MPHAFRVGELARVVYAVNRPRLIGRVVTILSELRPMRNSANAAVIPDGTPVHELSIPGDPGYTQWCAAPPAWLEPYREDREPVAWSECDAWIRKIFRRKSVPA